MVKIQVQISQLARKIYRYSSSPQPYPSSAVRTRSHVLRASILPVRQLMLYCAKKLKVKDEHL